MFGVKNSVDITITNKIMTAYISGDIDHHSAKTIREHIDTQLYLKRPLKLILDLSAVEMMDSSGLGLILGRYNKASEIKCEFALQNPGMRIMRILAMSGADRVINIETTKEKIDGKIIGKRS